MALHQTSLSQMDSSGPRGMGSFLRRCMQQSSTSAEALQRFRAAALLPPEAQRVIDDIPVRVGRQGLVLVNRLLNLGLTRPLPQWLGITEVGYDATNDVGHAQRTMVPKARGERQVADRTRRITPIPCTWDDFSFNIRELEMAQRVGLPLDTTYGEMATRRVQEAFEDQAWNGLGFNVHGNGAPGLLTNPTNTTVYSGGTAWTSKTGEQILTDLNAMISALDALDKPGPYDLYISSAYGLYFSNDWKANSSDSIRTRLQTLEFGGRNISIQVVPSLPTNKTVLLQTTSDVIDVIVGQQPTPLSWSDGPGFEEFFMILGCLVVRTKTDYNGVQGWVVGNTV